MKDSCAEQREIGEKAVASFVQSRGSNILLARLLQLAHVLDGAGVNAVLLDDLAVMEHVELLGGV
eukprot:CAMPEP_0195012418 /NCGR_PEP_ID=MMETSP0326_2-20130528/11807_1 /TAXON_ID=2866 ORGANISM="Crypthecodinium cohnii, Strain Seligo" /NCGR_SAMPLE_ID=MMETSP0326_2 /ASSEMBLY_ACC=CAM_ASM_000348 /LENGTH=64 /DNA_ID=CAMNT_0040022045 /DNA_START=249 /DNA_END=440 /DNA_ORIENTATION=+